MIRPSAKHPTIELRAADSCTRLDDAVAIAVLFRATVRAFDRDADLGAPLDRIGRAITGENKWRAQRYGVRATFVEPDSREAIDAGPWLERLIGLIGSAADAETEAAFAHLRSVIANGSSADEQVRVYQAATTAGRPPLEALRAVVDWAGRTTAG